MLAAQSIQDSEANAMGIMSTSGIRAGESAQEEQVLSASGSEFWQPSSFSISWTCQSGNFASAPLDTNSIDFNFLG
jgi:hypothetical protein